MLRNLVECIFCSAFAYYCKLLGVHGHFVLEGVFRVIILLALSLCVRKLYMKDCCLERLSNL